MGDRGQRWALVAPLVTGPAGDRSWGLQRGLCGSGRGREARAPGRARPLGWDGRWTLAWKPPQGGAPGSTLRAWRPQVQRCAGSGGHVAGVGIVRYGGGCRAQGLLEACPVTSCHTVPATGLPQTQGGPRALSIPGAQVAENAWAMSWPRSARPELPPHCHAAMERQPRPGAFSARVLGVLAWVQDSAAGGSVPFRSPGSAAFPRLAPGRLGPWPPRGRRLGSVL